MVSNDMTRYRIQFKFKKHLFNNGIGSAHGLGYGDNFLSALLSHCSKEMSDFIKDVHKTNRKINQCIS